MIRKLDMNDIENFKAVYQEGKEHLWPLEKGSVVNDLRCLLETFIELNEDVRSFERELTTIARKPDRRQSESRVCFWLRRIGEQLAEEADRTEKAERELASLRQCSTCCGTPHASGLPCICGGTNKAEDELKNLRLESMVLRDAVARMGEELRAKEEKSAGAKRCTCDDFGEGACPEHGEAMAAQDARNASAKLGLEDLPYEPECSVQRLDNWSAVDRQTSLTLPTWIVEDVKEWAVITDCEGDFVALVANDKADLIGKVLNEAGRAVALFVRGRVALLRSAVLSDHAGEREEEPMSDVALNAPERKQRLSDERVAEIGQAAAAMPHDVPVAGWLSALCADLFDARAELKKFERKCEHGDPLPMLSSGWCWCSRAMRAEAALDALKSRSPQDEPGCTCKSTTPGYHGVLCALAGRR